MGGYKGSLQAKFGDKFKKKISSYIMNGFLAVVQEVQKGSLLLFQEEVGGA
jgi:hypothetical protein